MRMMGVMLMVLLAMCGEAAAAADIRIDCSQSTGQIRPLHGGNCGPIQFGELVDLSAFHRELGIPFTRLHDCHWPNPDVVDIHAIFPDFQADPQRPASYDFSRTDDYVRAIVDVGSQVVYRLGESIEHTKKKYRVNPPADYQKWAAICVGIIRHYNEGWAGGFHYNIRYWEIWNEPENRPAMWTGSEEDYLRLYETAAKTIKARFPELKVGGPALGYTGKMVGGRYEPSEFMLRFLEHCRQRQVPVDFFSWHLYTNDPAECVQRARGIRATLDARGFAKAELHFNEWNYLPDNDWGAMMSRQQQGAQRERCYERIGGAEGAAFAACVLMNLQDSPVDVANYFMADNQPLGLFSFHGTPRKTFYAFKAFRLLLQTPRRVAAEGQEAGKLGVCAGTNAEQSAVGILVSNFKSAEQTVTLSVRGLPWEGPTLCQVFVVDEARNLEKIREMRLEAGQHPTDQPREGKASAEPRLAGRLALPHPRSTSVQIAQPLAAPSLCLIRLTPLADQRSQPSSR